MPCNQDYQILFAATETAELAPIGADPRPLGTREVAGRTVATLISAGTELACYQGLHGIVFPLTPGYAAVFEVAEVGSEVEAPRPGDLAFCIGPHRSFQRCDASEALPVPAGLPAAHAVFGRLMGVGMSTLTTTKARPPGLVAVLGLGPVGYLAARVFDLCGYRVIACDSLPERRKLAEEAGLRTVPRLPLDDSDVAGQVALVLECSGHEQAALDGCNVVRKGGEVVLVGVPWKRETDLTAHDLLDTVFHRYVVVRSGWEWEVPRHPEEFRTGSILGNIAGAMRWLAEGRIDVGELYEKVSPRDVQQAYQRLLHRQVGRLAVVLDWTELQP
jgi:threonine dehydrogenase-like Zn-dependent dehydrogenase